MRFDIDYLLSRDGNLTKEIKELEKRSARFSIIRLLSFLLVVVFCVLAFVIGSGKYLYFSLAAVIFIVFFALCIFHYRVNTELKFKRVLKDINDEYIARVKGDFSKLKDKGTEFMVSNHDYCVDLDIFGDESLFSLFNVSETAFGRKQFSDELLYAHTNKRTNDEIKKIQEATHVFSDDLEFLQEYQALARLGKISKMPVALLSLADEKDSFYSSKLRLVTRALLLLWLIPAVLIFVFPKAFAVSAFGVLIIYLIGSFIMSSRFGKFFKAIDGISRQCNAIYRLFEKLESKNYSNELIKSLINDKDSNEKLSQGLNELSKVCSMCAFRSQPLLALILNMLCLYDSLCADRLNRWVRKYGDKLKMIIDNLAKIESMMSASVVEIISKEASRPEFVDVSAEDNKNAYFKGEDILHPLLNRETAVANSIEIDSKIAIITGSNMSGKTTLIRTVGIMSILSYIGAYVPAKAVTLGRMRIVSSMRIVDSIKEEMSTFKAELVRISAIVNAGRENKPMLFLIDEIFRGTNSADRTDGAMEVLRILSRPMIIGFMTTHDYALCDIASEELDNITYYHFSETYDDEGIYFDYKLKDGMTKISNAKQLMKLVGIIL